MKHQLIAAIALGAAALVSHNAYAIEANGTFDGTITSITYAPAGELGDADSITLGSATQFVTNIAAEFDVGVPNDFVGLINQFSNVTFASTLLNITSFTPTANFLVFTSTGAGAGTTPANRFEFDANTLFIDSAGANTIGLVINGTFRDTTSAFETSTGQMTLTFNRSTGVNGSGSFSFFTQEVIPVPAPGALALMGLGLIGMRLVRRKAA